MSKLLLCILLVLASGCSFSKKEAIDYELGVIETTTLDRKTRFLYLDKNLNIVRKDHYKASTTSSSAENPSYQGRKVYFVPNGLTDEGIEKKILEVDRDTHQIKSYDVNRVNLQGIAVNEKYTYTISNDNTITYITQTDYHNKKVKELTFHDIITLTVLKANDKIIVPYGLIKKTEKQLINIYDTELNLIKKLDLSKYGHGITRLIVIGNKAYMPISSKFNYNTYDNDNNNLIAELDLKTLNYNIIKLKASEVGDVSFYKDWLVVVNSDAPRYEGNKITFYHTKTKEEKVYELKDHLARIERTGDYFYGLSYIKDGYKITRYSIKNNMKELNSKKFYPSKGYSVHYYCSNIFVKNN